jgi:Pectinacetylesterase
MRHHSLRVSRSWLRFLFMAGVFNAVETSWLTPPAYGADSTGWEKIPISGDALCADGSPYSIFVHRGHSGKLVLDFMGGGACWSAETCTAPNATYEKSVPDVIGQWLPDAGGIYDRTRAENPFRDDTHVMIPYCTGDVHWGSSDTDYRVTADSTKTIHHRGAINAKAAIDLTLSQIVPDPTQIFVTGCSAGAYGSIWWSPYIKQQSPHSKLTQFGDSGAGILTDQFRNDGFSNWHIERSVPRWIPGLDLNQSDITQLTMPQLYSAIAHELPDVKFSEFNALNDIVQRYFYKTMGGDQHIWPSQLRQTMNATSTSSSNFSYYISPWDTHCILPYEDFYGQARSIVGEQAFSAWLQTVLNGGASVNEPCTACAEDTLTPASASAL